MERHHKGIIELGSVVNGSWAFLFLRTVDFKKYTHAPTPPTSCVTGQLFSLSNFPRLSSEK